MVLPMVEAIDAEGNSTMGKGDATRHDSLHLQTTGEGEGDATGKDA